MNLPNLKEAKKRSTKSVVYKNQELTGLNTFQGKKYFLRTYGCQMNEHDSEEIEGILEYLGMSSTEEMENADVIILNTCAIRENAHDKVFGYLGRVKHLKKERPEVILAIGGCMSQEENIVSEIKKRHPYVNIVFGTHNIHELGEYLLSCNNDKQDIEVYSKEGDVIEFGNLYKRDSNISAWVNIMYGCDKFCTYCIVPYTRGKQRSRKSEDIIKEVKELKEAGYKEITLLGQNVNAYGKDLDDVSFARLLELVSDTGIPRIRFVTSHPWDFTDEMIDVIAERDNIMPYIHLPLQSGSSRILKLMGRRYSKDDYLTLYNKIRSKVKDVSITTDIIVGFPGETREDFEDTLKVVNECKYDGAFTFIFSPRENTPAASFEDNVSLKEKEDRLHELNELINKYSKESNLKMLNKSVKVLITGVSEKDDTKVCGYTENMKLVNVDAPKEDIGKIINVKITDAKSFSLDGIKES